MSILKDPSLYKEGIKKMDWALNYMPVIKKIFEEYETYKPLKDQKIVVSLRIDAKSANLVRVLKVAGAKVTVTSANPQSTQDDIVAGLYREGIEVFAERGVSAETYKKHLMLSLQTCPNILIDNNGDLLTLLHNECERFSGDVVGGCEETATGIRRAEARANNSKLNFPMIAASKARCQELFDQRYGTGQSIWSSIMSTTNLMLAGKNVVVAGYGWCGRGVALRAMGLGANLIVCEVDPVKALESAMDGCTVMGMDDAAKLGDIFITVTGCKNVIKREHFTSMKDGVYLTNAGHFDVEVNVKELEKMAKDKFVSSDKLETYIMEDGKRLNLIGGGRLVNLVVGEGNAAETMDLSLVVQAKSAVYIANNYMNLKNRVYNIPKEIDDEVAKIKLISRNIKIDCLSPEQELYLKSWEG